MIISIKLCPDQEQNDTQLMLTNNCENYYVSSWNQHLRHKDLVFASSSNLLQTKEHANWWHWKNVQLSVPGNTRDQHWLVTCLKGWWIIPLFLLLPVDVMQHANICCCFHLKCVVTSKLSYLIHQSTILFKK